MSPDSNTITVTMPDNSNLEVTYYCNDKKLNAEEKKKQTQLFIQLHDCICSLKIEKSLCDQPAALERLVHSKVVNTKGHLC